MRLHDGTIIGDAAVSETAPAFKDDGLTGVDRPSPKGLLSKPAVFGSLIPIVTILNAVVGMILPQLMDPRGFGQYSLVVTFFNYGLIFDLGAAQIMDRRIPSYIGSGQRELARVTGEKLLWLRLAIAVIAFVLTGLVMVALAIANELPFDLPAGMLSALAGFADMVALGAAYIYRANSMRREYAILTAITLAGLIVARPGGLIAAGLTGCFGALSVWYVTCAIFFLRPMNMAKAARPDVREALSLIRYGIPFFATSFVWGFYVTANRWFASFVIDAEQFGHFAFSANLFSLLVGAAGGYAAFYYPKIVERIAGSGHYSMSGIITRDLCAFVALMTCIVGVGIILADFLVRTIYPQYLPGIDTARIILVAVPAMALASWLLPLSLCTGNRPVVDGFVIYPLATVILGTSITLLHRHAGQNGVAWASTAGALALIAMQLAMLRHERVLRTRHALVLFAFAGATCAALGLLAWRLTA